MNSRCRILIGTLFLILAMHGSARADSGSGSPLAAVAWLEGGWAGEGLGGQVEEYWMRAPDGRLTGVFQFLLEGRQVFNEIEMLAEFEDGLAMRVKHFSPELEQWDSDHGVGVSFPVLEIGENFFQCEGLRYELEGEILTVSLDMTGEDGAPKVENFVMRRK
jgi:hypothetical protein